IGLTLPKRGIAWSAGTNERRMFDLPSLFGPMSVVTFGPIGRRCVLAILRKLLTENAERFMCFEDLSGGQLESRPTAASAEARRATRRGCGILHSFHVISQKTFDA